MPESDDARIAAATDRLLKEGAAAKVTLFVAPQNAKAYCDRYGVDLTVHGPKIEWLAAGELPETKARLALAADLLGHGKVDAVLAGNQATTADVIRAGIGGVGLAHGVRTVSGAFIMYHDDGRQHLFADCGVVIAPTVRQLSDIAYESVRTWRELFPSIPPVIAFLSFSTKGSAQHEAASKMAEAAELFRERCPDVQSDGELQFDAAMDAAICARKAPGSPVAGAANCFVFPDLGAGNIAYKITQRLGGYEACGPILQGLSRPFSDLSRGSTVNDIVSSAYVNLLRPSSAS